MKKNSKPIVRIRERTNRIEKKRKKLIKKLISNQTRKIKFTIIKEIYESNYEKMNRIERINVYSC